MNTLEALALVISEQRDQIDQLEQDVDIMKNRALRYETQFNMSENALLETREALRLCGAEVSELKRQLSEYTDQYVYVGTT
jgi:chromosome segregation ATPase